MDDKDRARYELIMHNLSDPETSLDILRQVRNALIPLSAYRAVDHPPHVAVAILSELRVLVEGIFDDIDFVDRYIELNYTEGEEQ